MDKLDNLRDWSESVFRNLQPRYDGGILSILTPVVGLQQSTFTAWVADVSYKPFFNVCLFIAIVWSLVLPMTIFIFIIRSCCRRLHCCIQCRQRTRACLDNISRECLHRKLDPKCPPCVKRCSLKIKRDSITCAIFVTTVVLVIGLSAGIYFTIHGSTHFQNMFESSNSSSMVSASIDEVVAQLEAFMDDGVKSANSTTIKILADFSKYFQTRVANFVDILTIGLLKSYGATATLDKADKVILGIEDIFSAMTFIKDKRVKLFQDINEFLGGISYVVRQLLRNELPKLCTSLTDVKLKQDCERIVLDSDRLSSQLREGNIMFDTSSAVLHMLKIMNLDISVLSKESEASRKEVQKLVTIMHEQAQREFKIDSFLVQIPSVWNYVDAALNSSVKVSLRKFQKSNPIPEYSTTFVKYWKLAFDIILALVVCSGLIGMLACALAIVLFSFKRIQKKSNSKKEQYEINLKDLYTNSQHSSKSDADYKIDPKPAKSSAGYSKLFTIFMVSHLLFGGLIILPCLFASASFIAGGILTTEVCRYFAETRGVAVADSVVNSYISKHWANLTSSINVTQMLLSVTLKQPQDPLMTIYSKCASSNATLVESLNMTGILDASDFPKLPMYHQMAKNGEKYVVERVLSLGLASIIPMSLLTFINRGIDFLARFVDPMNYSQSINELKKTILHMNVTEFSDLVSRLDVLLYKSDPHHASMGTLRHVLKLMRRLKVTYTNLTLRLLQMRKHFELLEHSPEMAVQLKQLKEMLLHTKSKLTNKTYIASEIYKQYPIALRKITDELVIYLQKSLLTLEKSLFPCLPLHKAYIVTTSSVCGRSRHALNSFTLAIGITVIWAQLLFCFTWCLISHLKPNFFTTNDSKC